VYGIVSCQKGVCARLGNRIYGVVRALLRHAWRNGGPLGAQRLGYGGSRLPSICPDNLSAVLSKEIMTRDGPEQPCAKKNITRGSGGLRHLQLFVGKIIGNV